VNIIQYLKICQGSSKHLNTSVTDVVFQNMWKTYYLNTKTYNTLKYLRSSKACRSYMNTDLHKTIWSRLLARKAWCTIFFAWTNDLEQTSTCDIEKSGCCTCMSAYNIQIQHPHTHTHTYKYAYVCTCIYIFIYICMYVYVYMYIYIFYIVIYLYIYNIYTLCINIYI